MPIKLWVLFLTIMTVPAFTARAADIPCTVEDNACLIKALDGLTATITEDNWRDQTWRELAKLMAASGMIDEALAIVPKVKTPDTQAMTIRGIGMAAAEAQLPRETMNKMFAQLRIEADRIGHPPSHAIALTYIGMAQAFSGDDAGAMATAASMENAALRNKAYAETAEIQAERNDLPAVMKSLAAINDNGYKDKEMAIIVKIFADRKQYANALAVAQPISNSYQQSQALLYILTKQIQPEKPHEGSVTP